GVAGIAAAEGYHAVEADASIQSAPESALTAPAPAAEKSTAAVPNSTDEARYTPSATSTADLAMPGAAALAGSEQPTTLDPSIFVPPVVPAARETASLASAPTWPTTVRAAPAQAHPVPQSHDVTDFGQAPGAVPPVADIEPGGAGVVQLPSIEVSQTPLSAILANSEQPTADEARETTVVM